MTYFIPTTLVGMADATSSPTTFVGMVIPTKLLGTVYFDKSCHIFIVMPDSMIRLLGYRRSFVDA